MQFKLKTFSVLAIGLLGLSQIVLADEFSDKYGSINDRNIFLKDRQRPRPPTSRNAERIRSTAPEESPETRIVLRGVVIEDNELRAYFENTRGNTITRVIPGDTIGKGHVAEIAIDAVQYELEGRLVWIEIGHNLLGARASAMTSPPLPRPSIPTPPSNPTAPVGTTMPPAVTTANPNEEGVEPVAPTAPTAGAVDPSTLSIEERLKLRRAAEKTGAR